MTSDFDKFLEERLKIPIPSGDSAWVKLLAQELAIGANRNLWSPRRIINYGHRSAPTLCSNAKVYFERRWSDRDLVHMLEILISQRYLVKKAKSPFLDLTQKAFDLIDDIEPFNIFISYRRLDSSALALLVLARLKEHGLVPFVDMALEAGGNWHAELEDRIKSCDYFIILLGKDTLESQMTAKEIRWALQYNRSIIPIWHSGFNLTDKNWAEIDQEVEEAIQQTNAIRVLDESANGYNTALVELLNRFGITP